MGSLVSQKARARFELRKLRLPTEEASPVKDERPAPPQAKRREIVDTREYACRSASPTDSDVDSLTSEGESQSPRGTPLSSNDNTVKVVRLAWLQESLSRGKLLDYREYLVFEAVRESHKVPAATSAELMQRAREVAAASSQTSMPLHAPYGRHREGGHHNKAPSLLPRTTTDEHVMANLPQIPDYLKIKHSCQRPTLVHPPNEAFIDKLKEVRELRAMRGDHIGVRAYSTAIASLSAYPYKLQSPIGEPFLAIVHRVPLLITTTQRFHACQAAVGDMPSSLRSSRIRASSTRSSAPHLIQRCLLSGLSTTSLASRPSLPRNFGERAGETSTM